MRRIVLLVIIGLSMCLSTACEIFKDPDDIDIENISDSFVEGYITEEQTKLETEHFIIDIEKNIYVPGYISEHIEILYDTIELVSNMKFYNQNYNSGKIILNVEKNYASESEFKSTFTNSKSMIIHLSAGDLLLGNSYTLVHELAHVLQYSQSTWDYSEVFVEGFAEYNSYKVIKYLEEHNMLVAKMNESSKSHIANMKIDGDVYGQSINYWFENPEKTYDIAINGAYAIGMRFINYLDDVYGDYNKWIYCYEQENPYYVNPFANAILPMNVQKNIFVTEYGEDVFNNFYTWLRKNEPLLYESPWSEESPYYDLTDLDYTYIYPCFNDNGNQTVMTRFYKFEYDNLYIVIDETRNYLEKYKGKDVSDLKLKLSSRTTVKLYDSNDNLIESRRDDEFSLKGVSYIKLAGKGTLGEKNRHGLKIIY